MKVKAKKDFKLSSECTALKGYIFDLVTINSQIDTEDLLVILEKNGQVFSVHFKNTADVNEHLKFNCEEEISTTEVYITDGVYINENESNRRIKEVYDEQQKKIEYWKSKCMKLIEMI